MTRLIASASALLLTAGTAAAHTAEAAHSHNEMVIAVAFVVAVGARRNADDRSRALNCFPAPFFVMKKGRNGAL